MVVPEGACMVALEGGHVWLLSGGMRGCSGGVCMLLWEGVHGSSRGGCVVALGGHAWLLQGGHAWLLQGEHAWLLQGGVHFSHVKIKRSMSGQYASYNAFLSQNYVKHSRTRFHSK